MLAILVVAILGVVTLWFYGSFWTTAFFIILGGDLSVCCYEHLLSVFICVFFYRQLGIHGIRIQMCTQYRYMLLYVFLAILTTLFYFI